MSALASPYAADKLRRSGMHFLLGKAASGALTFLLVIVLVRVLPRQAYGVYVSLIAGCELGYALAGLGLAWLGARFIPEYYLKGNRVQLARLVLVILAGHAAALLVLAGAVYLGREPFLVALRLTVEPGAFFWFLAVLVLEGLGRMTREGVLGPLLQQRAIQVSVVLRQAGMLGGVLWLVWIAQISLVEVAWLECIASGLGLGTSLGFLMLHLWRLPTVQTSNWQPPSWRALWSPALAMYVSHLLSLVSGVQVLLLLLQRALGAEAAAVFGFLVNLYGQIGRYLPAALFFSLVRPKLIASYLESGVKTLVANAQFVGGLSLIALFPAIALVAVGGDEIIALLSGGKFTHAGGWFLGLLIALIPFSQRQLLETIAVACGQGKWCPVASLASLLGVGVMLLMLDHGLGVGSAVLGVLVSQWAFNWALQGALRWQISYRPDWRPSVKLWLATALTAAIAWPIALPGIVGLGVQGGVILAVFFACVWQLKVIDNGEWQKLRYAFGRR